MNKQELRKLIRKKRRAVSPAQRRAAAHGLKCTLNQSPRFLSRRRVALYLSNDGEIDPHNVIEDLWSRKCEVYLPVLHPLRKGHLSFMRYTPSTPMRRNRYGIAEPDFAKGQRVSPKFIGAIGLPLVAFDERGNRLGMGGGYYDRTLAFMSREGHKPTLIGCAFEFQQVRLLPAESWDIPLRMIATERHLTRLA